MFCPKCGTQNDDDSAFCSNCGAQLEANQPVAKAEPSAMRPEQQSPSAAYDSLGSSYQTPATVTDGGTSKKSKAPLVVIAVLAIVLIAGGAFAIADPMRVMPWNASREGATAKTEVSASGDSSNGGAGSSDSSTQKTDGNSNVMTEKNANRISPKESIKVSDLKITEDKAKRYVVTGKIENASSETYDVKLKFRATRHSSDKYGEETTKKEDMVIQATVTPFTVVSDYGHSFTVPNLAPTKDGKTVTFTLYPVFDSVEESLSDPTCEVVNASLPSAQAEQRFDHDNGIDIKSKQVTADGKAVIEFVNNTGMYLDSTEVTLVCYNDQDIPAVYNKSGSRPYGAVVKSASAETLKPGDKGTFETYIGEGFSKVEVLHTTITPDPNKNSFN